jgi:ribosomal-protein-alanine N-acetyltransferase
VTATAPRTDVGVRQASRGDLLAVFRIEKRSFPQAWPYAAFERFLDEPGFLVAESDGAGVASNTGEIVGYVVADSVPNHGVSIGHIKDLAVAPEHRGEGIGRLLLARALTTLASEGVGRVKLEVRETNAAALSLYRDFGFEVHHAIPEYYDDGEDAYVMVREM